MTKEEAIAILQESRRQEKCLIDNYTTFFTTKNATDGVHNARKRYIALDMAISAMQKLVKLDRSRWEGCGYCEDGSPYSDLMYNYQARSVDVGRYCKMCGRPLTEEAWEQLERRIGGNDGKIDF